jgi:hypothetical protein
VLEDEDELVEDPLDFDVPVEEEVPEDELDPDE